MNIPRFKFNEFSLLNILIKVKNYYNFTKNDFNSIDFLDELHVVIGWDLRYPRSQLKPFESQL